MSDVPSTIRESVAKVREAFRPTFSVSTKASATFESAKGSLSEDIVDAIVNCKSTCNHTEARKMPVAMRMAWTATSRQ